MSDTIAVPVLLPDIRIGNLLRCHLRTGIGTGRFPMIKTGSCCSTLLRCALLHNNDRKTLPRCRNGRKTTRKTAAKHQHITLYDLLPAHLIPVRPAVFSMFHVSILLLIPRIYTITTGSKMIPTHIMMLGSKGLLPPTDAYELLRCKAAPAIL